MKLLWISNAPWAASGYGSQTRQVVTRIRDAGYEVECVANDGTRGDREWNGILVRGSGMDRYSRDSVREDVERSGADRVLFLYDAWVFTSGWRDPFEDMRHVYGWVPVDHYPTPLALYGWLGNGHHAIAMSQFGEMCLRDTAEGFRRGGQRTFPVSYAPHAIDRSVFTPRDRRFRDAIGVPQDAYLVGIVGANTGTEVYDRKGFGDMAHALAVFMEAHPDAYVYVHSHKTGHQAMNLEVLFGFKGVPADRIRWADQYELTKQSVTDEDMAFRYSALDVLLMTSRGEGFGIPAAEALACGVPAIVSNWTAQTEIVGDRFDPTRMSSLRFAAGWAVGVDPDWDPRQGSDFGKPRLGSIIGALGEAYERRGDQELRDAAYAKSAQFDADTVFDAHWRPILELMDKGQPLRRRERRAQAREAAKAGAR